VEKLHNVGLHCLRSTAEIVKDESQDKFAPVS